MRSAVAKLARVALCALLAVPGLGCIGIQSNDARVFDAYPPADIAGSTQYGIDVVIAVQSEGASAGSTLRGGTGGNVRNAYAYHLERTGRVRIDPAGPYQVQILVQDQGPSSGAVFAGFVTVFTLYVVPSWASHDYRTALRILDADGRVLGETRYTHRLTVVQQLLLALGMPFAGIQEGYDRMWNAVMRDAAVWTIETLMASGAPPTPRESSGP